MRAHVSTLLACALFAAPAAAADRNFGVSGFDKIRVTGPFRVRVATGVAPFARASGSASAIQRVAMDVQGQTLVVHVNPSAWGGYPGQSADPVEVTVGTHELSIGSVNGAGSLDIDRVRGLSFTLSVQGSGGASIGDADADQLRINLVGSSNATVGGRTGKLTAVLRGISSLDASALAAKDASIAAEGASTVQAQVANEATVEAVGTTTVTLTGNPACTLRSSGSATVAGCKSGSGAAAY